MPTKIALCMPSRGEQKAGFGYDLARMVAYTCKNMPDVQLAFIRGTGTLIHDLRRDLARDALTGGADWLLFLDDDMRFPPDALERLLKHRRDIVGVNYVTRTIPPRPTAKRASEDGTNFNGYPTRPDSTGLDEVDGMGFGLMLINARVFKTIEEPWFSMPWSPPHQCHVGEDIYFCTVAGAAGFKTFIDHDLSKEVKHVGEFEFTWDHFEAIQEQPPACPPST